MEPEKVPLRAESIVIERPFGIMTVSVSAGTASLSQFVPVFQLPSASAVLVAAYASGICM